MLIGRSALGLGQRYWLLILPAVRFLHEGAHLLDTPVRLNRMWSICTAGAQTVDFGRDACQIVRYLCFVADLRGAHVFLDGECSGQPQPQPYSDRGTHNHWERSSTDTNRSNRFIIGTAVLAQQPCGAFALNVLPLISLHQTAEMDTYSVGFARESLRPCCTAIENLQQLPKAK